MQITILSSNGHFTINHHGDVLAMEPEEAGSDDDKHFQSVSRFDIDEWKRYWDNPIVPSCLDILDLGYWYTAPCGTSMYEGPDQTWREDIAIKLLGRARHAAI